MVRIVVNVVGRVRARGRSREGRSKDARTLVGNLTKTLCLASRFVKPLARKPLTAAFTYPSMLWSSATAPAQQETHRFSALQRWTTLILFVAVAVAAILSIRPLPVGVFQDDGIYVALAKSLATGNGYRYLNLPGNPIATHYPPLYPSFLAILWKLSPSFPENIAVFKFANSMLLAGAAVAFYRLTKRVTSLSAGWAALIVAGFTISAPTLILAAMVLSEPLFLVLLAIALMTCERVASTGSLKDAAFAGLAIVFLAMCRTIGAVLLPALIIVLVWRRRWWPALMTLGVAVLGLLPWQLWVTTHGDAVPSVLLGKYGPYFEWVLQPLKEEGAGFLIHVGLVNMRELWAHLYMTAGLSGGSPWWLRVVCAMLIGLTLAIGARRLSQRAPVMFFFLCFYFVVVLVWPFSPTRFIYAIWPLIGVTFSVGVQDVLRLWRSDTDTKAILSTALWNTAIALVVCTNVLGMLAFNVQRFSLSRGAGVERESAERALPVIEWVINSTDPDDVIVTDDDVMVHLYTGRKTVPATTFTAQEYLQPQTDEFIAGQTRELIRLYEPQYLITSTLMATKGARSLVLAEPPELKHVATLTVGAVFIRTSPNE